MEHFGPKIKEIENKKIIITGGTEGIGKAIASELSINQNVAICARHKKNDGVLAYEVDLIDRHLAKGFVETAIRDLGGLDLIILNAALSGVPHNDETNEESQQRKSNIFKVNEVAQVALTRAASEQLRETKGTIVFLTSGLAHKSIPGTEDYGESKKRVEEFLNDFMSRPGNEEINYFSVSPGAVDTRMHEEIANHGPVMLAGMSKNAKEKGLLTDPNIIGKIIAKMAVNGLKFNSETNAYDLPIKRGEIVDIKKSNIQFESSQDS